LPRGHEMKKRKYQKRTFFTRPLGILVKPSSFEMGLTIIPWGAKFEEFSIT